MEYREDSDQLKLLKKDILDLMSFKTAVAREWLTSSSKKRPHAEGSSLSDLEDNQPEA